MFASYKTQFLNDCRDLLDFIIRCKTGLNTGLKRDGSNVGFVRQTRLKGAPVSSEGVSTMTYVLDPFSFEEASGSGQGDITIKPSPSPERVLQWIEASRMGESDNTTQQLLNTSLLGTTEPSGNGEVGSAPKLQLDASLLTEASNIGRDEGGSATKQPSDTLMREEASDVLEQLLHEAPGRCVMLEGLEELRREHEASGSGDILMMEASDNSSVGSSAGTSKSDSEAQSPFWSDGSDAGELGLGPPQIDDLHSATKHMPGARLLWSLRLTEASSKGEGSATQQPPDASLVCRLKDVVCLLLSYSISVKGTDRDKIIKWIIQVHRLVNESRLAMVGLYSDGFKSINFKSLFPHALKKIEFHHPYWFPLPSKEPEEILGATSESVDLAVESAIAQLKICFVGKLEKDIKLIAITGEGATKVTSSLKDSGYVENMFDYVISISVSEDGDNLGVHDEIRRQLSPQLDMYKSEMDIIILLDDVHNRLNLLEWRPPSSFQYGSGVFLHFKMVVVTRLQGVEQPLAVDLEIRMEDHLVPWSVFSSNVGQILHTSTAIQSIAASIVKRCQGHLLAITVLARALRGIADTDVWEDALYLMALPVAGCNTGTRAVMINALKFCLSRENRETRQYIKNYLHSGRKSILVGSFSLEMSEDGEGVMMEEEIRQILLNSSLLDACEMLEDGESNATEIALVNRGISQLPQSPCCPMLTRLFLQMNSGLMLIPSSFFRHMACLRVLDLSNTSISSLPESLFQLSSLEELCLCDCELFMVLPPQIKELKNLMVLDLEGTALVNLPKEIGNLEKLACLKVSFHGDLDFNGEEYPSGTMIPTGVLSKLSMLMTLSLDVNPTDKRWDEAVKVVIRELPYLEQLGSLEMYLPEVTLLDELIISLPSLIHDSAINFRLTVGRHQRQIMSRVPRGVEGRFRNLSKCLKYVNGNEGNSNVSAQVMDVLKNSNSFFLNRHFTITDLTKLGIGNLNKLRFCVLGENDKLVTIMEGTDPYEGTEKRPRLLPVLEDLIIYRMKNMRSICEGPLQKGTMCRLKSLTLNGCPRLEVVFAPGLLYALFRLEELIIEDCPAISSLVRESIEEIKVLNRNGKRFLRQLKNISLHHLPKLENIFSSLNMEPAVERVSIYDCPKLKSLPDNDFFSEHSKVFRGEKHWLSYLHGRRHDNAFHARRVFVPFRRDSHFKTQLAADGFNF